MKTVWSVVLFLLPAAALAEAPAKPATVGKKIDNFKLRDYRGAERSLQDFAEEKLVVLAFLGCDCPLAKLYGPRLAELAQQYKAKGVTFVGINANRQDSISAIGQYAKAAGIAFPILKDVGNVVADQLGAERTPEVFVLDAQRVVRYRGRIDDQYGIGYVRPRPVQAELVQALDELLAGKPVTTATTRAPGCFIGRMQRETPAGEVTYAKHIAPLLQRRCIECHQEGEIAPFALTSYDEVVGWTDTIEEVVRQQRMPPWHADPKYGRFANDSHLSDDEKQLLFTWIKNGAPQGDLRDLPKPIEYARGWRIPKPDVVIPIPKPIAVAATGDMPYEFIVADPGFTEDKWIKAAEVVPGCRAVVHHILVFVQPPGGGSDRYGGFATNWLVGNVPGARPLILPEGMAKRIPAGSRLLFQIHYTPNGRPQTDRTVVGLVFADPKTLRKEVSTEMAANPRLVIPPRTEDQLVESDYRVDRDSLMLDMTPHTHLRGKAFKFEALYPDGSREVLLDVPHYDFNWQNTYVLTEPKRLPKGTRLHCEAHYNNSRNNPANPDPEAEVHWGDQTWEEMMIGYFNLIPLDQDLQKDPPKVAQTKPLELPALDPQLKELALHALDSQEAFEAFAAAVHKAVPNVDRVCVTSFSHGNLKVERASYCGAVAARFAETGFEKPAHSFMLAHIALVGSVSYVPDLKKARGADMMLISKTLASSVHVPLVLEGGKPADLNFWSKEAGAFPLETRNLFRALARAVASHQKQ